jgi:hypothetical protein
MDQGACGCLTIVEGKFDFICPRMRPTMAFTVSARRLQLGGHGQHSDTAGGQTVSGNGQEFRQRGSEAIFLTVARNLLEAPA